MHEKQEVSTLTCISSASWYMRKTIAQLPVVIQTFPLVAMHSSIFKMLYFYVVIHVKLVDLVIHYL